MDEMQLLRIVVCAQCLVRVPAVTCFFHILDRHCTCLCACVKFPTSCFNSLKGSKRRRKNNHDGDEGATRDHQNVDPEARKQAAMQLVMDVMQDKDQLGLSGLLSEANTATPPGSRFTREELEGALTSLDSENKIMFYDDMVHKV